MRVSVLGCGRWGSFHAWYAARVGHAVTLWGRAHSAHLKELRATRTNEFLMLPEDIRLTDDLAEAVRVAEIVIISIHAQALRSFLRDLCACGLGGTMAEKTIILCMKGLEIGTGKRLSTVVHEELGDDVHPVVWVGPGHVQDFVRGIPNCMVLAGEDRDALQGLVDALGSPLIRFYYGEDLLGTEVGAAAKNVVGLAAGMLDGLEYGSLKGALMARGTRELVRLVRAMGGDGETIYGLSHLGDYEATLFSPHSNNRRYGEAVVRGTAGDFHKIAEGVYTAEALMALSEEYGVDLPISATVYEIVTNGRDPRAQLTQLFLRATKSEKE
ncbi:glycerol-3-phosphate dehydrogenase [Selenomonas sp. oral taxon 126]|uniref:NAD(P)H-dependent glycerol-3-phosphate dehydrogenase n=1 Tax=Selenomonas sp. oral taxon 126 TaxID=712528 RepID=UPI0008078B5E|nr:NAD(P)H-dependent glycerol-3-phosphate dehydrogenase [Selenomonas sp. oral taxon 126]ANR71598.1 glycerol-3-phosphate dehydrogenase [Selenomonas sp. oral taxon 126]